MSNAWRERLRRAGCRRDAAGCGRPPAQADLAAGLTRGEAGSGPTGGGVQGPRQAQGLLRSNLHERGDPSMATCGRPPPEDPGRLGRGAGMRWGNGTAPAARLESPATFAGPARGILMPLETQPRGSARRENWREGGDSNPRGAINACLISSQVHSTTLPPSRVVPGGPGACIIRFPPRADKRPGADAPQAPPWRGAMNPACVAPRPAIA